jgi:hypothetical protein
VCAIFFAAFMLYKFRLFFCSHMYMYICYSFMYMCTTICISVTLSCSPLGFLTLCLCIHKQCSCARLVHRCVTYTQPLSHTRTHTEFVCTYTI